MVEAPVARRSPLEEVYRVGQFGALGDGGAGVDLTERRAMSIVQVDAWADRTAAAADAVEQSAGVRPPRQACTATDSGNTAAIWVGPDRWIIVEKERRDLYGAITGAVSENLAAITDQSHSRCVLRISGHQSRNVLGKGTTLDMDPGQFTPGDARSTALFHMGSLIHCVGNDTFDLYVARSFGQSFFEALTRAAAEYGYRVGEPS